MVNDKLSFKKQQLLELVKDLDISPTMHKNATDKYKAVAEYLQSKGLKCDIYPQGSFSLGTVTRPYRNSNDVDYDLDFICEIQEDKESTTPKIIKFKPRDLLLMNEVYEKILNKKEYDKCWTLEYADIGSVGFNMDIVPGIHEDNTSINTLMKSGILGDIASTAINITNKSGNGHYSWYLSNPKGYKKWFDNINKPFLDYQKEIATKKSFNERIFMSNKIEEIPDIFEHSSLQRVIQLLKRHRDVYYSKGNKENIKPISAIITTICAEIALTAPKNLDLYDLLSFIIKEFGIYSNIQTLNEDVFQKTYEGKHVIKTVKGQWTILNPVNPNDNLADSWNKNPEIPKYFFLWVKQIKDDFLNSMEVEDIKFVQSLENGLGSSFVSNHLDKSKFNLAAPTATAIISAHVPHGDDLYDK